MGLSFSIGNQGYREPQLQKNLLKHLGVSARDIATAGRQFPITARIDIQSGLESILTRYPETQLVGIVAPNGHEGLTFAQMLGPHGHVDLVHCNTTTLTSGILFPRAV